MHFCLIDDDPRLLATLRRGLAELGHECEAFQSSPDALARLLDKSQAEPDLILLDVMMPSLDGWDFLTQLREGGRRTPVIYLSARRDVDDRVRGLGLSADDYVVKPFVLKELLARSEAVLRRQGFRDPIEVDGVVIHRNRARVDVGGSPIEVSNREHEFLETLASNPDRVFSRPELLHRLWQIDFDPQTNVVEVLVARIRKKLGGDAARMIETVVGEGYRLRRPRSK